ncbi:peptidoglycan-binding domain-containing protein [Ruegeria sp. 2205SS24-7]|uniref:peptidoglycan-binding domain-containing protein n=1 Tax=Ruegeria discodermiae TaxID=3064389 RepID=UPI002740787D|nr:peptidoglycan-binding domain-containing protein [Ruegeria sp. 2205SS24-7]MDP5220903.1 peptidoglycan-binding domain-containing protein [Ruegeria sp. 2205SS24-7]
MKKLKNGSKGRDVKALQTALNKPPLKAGLKVDGIFGDKTEASVRAYQRRNRVKKDGIAGPKTLASLGLGKPSGGGGSKGSDWPHTDVHETVDEVASKYKATRTIIDKHLSIAHKIKTGDMRETEAEMLAAWKALDKTFRDVFDILQNLERMEKDFMRARRDKPASAGRILKRAKPLYRKAAQALLKFLDACTAVEEMAKKVEATKSASAKIKPLDSFHQKDIRGRQLIRDLRQKKTLKKMRECADRDAPEFKEIRLRYLRLEVEAEKAHKLWWSNAEIVLNLQDMHNRAIPTASSKELKKLRDRHFKQMMKCLALMKASDRMRKKAEAIDKELEALQKLQPA